MARNPSHKKLVDAVLDAEAHAQAVADDAEAKGAATAQQWRKIVANVIDLRATGKLTPGEAKAFLMQGWRALSLGVFARVAHDVVSAGNDIDAIITEAKRLGKEVLRVEALTKVDAMERAAEKANGDA